jgi:hypothetical protein
MGRNIWSLGLLRNGKVYASKELAIQGLVQTATNDGVAKLARYLEASDGGPIIRTVVGFYANASEMEDPGNGQSSYTVLDIDGISEDLKELSEAIEAINNIIGTGLLPTTLTEAINEINAKIGEGFDENFTVADALDALEAELTDKLTISLEEAGTPTSGMAKTYVLSQGVGSGKTEIGRIDIPKDLVVKSGKLVYGLWEGDVFHENTEETHYGDETAIKLVLNNEDVIYINTQNLVDIYTASDGISIEDNAIAVKLDAEGEPFLTVGADGLKLDGVQAAIDLKADQERLSAGDGISIAGKVVKAVAAKFSAPGVANPIVVEEDGIKMNKALDCGFYDYEPTVVETAGDIGSIVNPRETDVVIDSDEALNSLTAKKTFKSIEVANVEADNQIYLSAVDSIIMDNIDVTGDKGSSNGYFLYDAKEVEVSNITVVDGAKPYNVFEGSQEIPSDSFKASNITVNDVALKHNVFNIYKVNNDAIIKITDGVFNLDVNNSNVLRLSNLLNATGVTVEFEDIDWTYENTPNIASADFGWAGLIIYQPFGADAGKATGDLTAMKTWTFKFKNCRYNGLKVTANNFGRHNQVFYMYDVKNLDTISDPVANGLNVIFE